VPATFAHMTINKMSSGVKLRRQFDGLHLPLSIHV
jgi:hypothetical protein